MSTGTGEDPEQPPTASEVAEALRVMRKLGGFEGLASIGREKVLLDPASFVPVQSVGYRAGDDVDLTNEEPEPFNFAREPIPPAERTRRGVLIGLAVAFAAVFLLQIGFATLGGTAWERVGPVLSAAATLIGGGFGFAWGHYFSGKD